MPASGTPLPWDHGNGPCVMAPPHLRGWAEEAAAFLSRRGMDEITAFATSGSSGSPPKAILFTRRALDICARGALEHLHAENGDWCCPLPVWHVGGAMIYLRAALAGTAVHTLRGKWCPKAYADLMRSSGARWSSLVPTQVVDLVRLGLRAPSTAECIIVGGGALDAETGRKARTLGWPVVQSYGMTEAGSGRLLTQPHGGFLLERVAPQEWWSTRDLVRLEGHLLTFLRRADRLVKVLGELVDPDAVQDVLRRSVPEAVVEAVPHPRAGMELVACGPSAALLEQACRAWNAAAPGPQRIRAVMETPIPLTVMGKLDRNRLRSQLSDHPEQLRKI